jgi:hypothetical protein
MFGLNPETMVSGLLRNPTVNDWFDRQFKPLAESIQAHIETVACMEAKLDAIMSQQAAILTRLNEPNLKEANNERLYLTDARAGINPAEGTAGHGQPGDADACGDSRRAGVES